MNLVYGQVWSRLPPMSRQELVGAYLDGQVSRRTLIRRLVAGGVSTGAAIAYAQMLRPERAFAGLSGDDHYPLVDLRITSKTLAGIRETEKVRVKVTSSEEINALYLRAVLKTPKGGVLLGFKAFYGFLDGAGSKSVAVPIMRERLAGRKSARIYVQATGRDGENLGVITSVGKSFD